MARRRLMFLGLDGADLELLQRFTEETPTLTRLLRRSIPLPSSVPPITIPAWLSMFTGLDPGELGVYGFRDRHGTGYGDLSIAKRPSPTVAPRVWDRLSARGFCSFVIGVPGTYPPWPFRGRMVASLPVPPGRRDLCWPGHLQAEVDALGYQVDVEGHRGQSRGHLLEACLEMTRRRFALARAWAAAPDWDLFVLVEIGCDRIHHAFLGSYLRGAPEGRALPSYYAALDAEIADLLSVAGDAAVLVASDHGSKPIEGGFALNDWLRHEGDLVLRHTPALPVPLTPELVDWTRTRAWAEGGHFGRVFVNVRGREPQGTVPPAEIDRVRADLAARLEAAKDPAGRPLGNRVLWPEHCYRCVRGLPPDLFVYAGGLRLRVLAEVGAAAQQERDEANHREAGLFAGPEGLGDPPRSVLDVAGLIMGFFGAS